MVNFSVFIGTFLKINNIKKQALLLFISLNLRKAIFNQFDLFVQYCYEEFDAFGIDFNILRYKGKLLLEYALGEEYHYAVGLFMLGKDQFFA